MRWVEGEASKTHRRNRIADLQKGKRGETAELKADSPLRKTSLKRQAPYGGRRGERRESQVKNERS